jgi:hypothetical protein
MDRSITTAGIVEMALSDNVARYLALVLAVCWFGQAGDVAAQKPGGSIKDLGRIEHSTYKVDLAKKLQPRDLDHPLTPIIQIAYDSLRFIDLNIDDYTCRLVARARINGQLKNHEFMSLKVRHRKVVVDKTEAPFAVYIRYEGPSSVFGREVLYVEGKNNNELLARNGGDGNLQDVTMSMHPTSPRAMRSHRYPLTEIGVKTLIDRLVEIAHESLELDRDRRECEVKIGEDAKIDGRGCRVIQVRFPIRRPGQRFQLARVFVDKRIPVPIRYESYAWPRKSGDPPLLMEEYTYLDLKTNVGLTDSEFDRNKPDYKFFRRETNAEDLKRNDVEGSSAGQ